MSFWDYKLNILEVYKTKIENARKGILDKKTKSSPESYIETLEKKIKGIQYRLDSLICAKENMEKYDRVFFSFGKKDAMAFGSPLNNCLFWQTVRRATAIATYELFGEAKWINPHAFRNMAEKHLRLIGKGDQADAFGALIGHSKEMGDEYANQILSEYEITEDIVDNWWIDDFR
jgi:hypothetical protein